MSRKCLLDIGAGGTKWFDDVHAEYLGISKDTVYTWVTNKNMPGHKAERLWKFKTHEIDEWIRAGGAVFADRAKGYS